MHRPLPRLALICCSLALSALLGCGAEAVRRTAPVEEAHFAEQYIRALHDSGLAGIASRSQPDLISKPNFQETVETLRKVLQTYPRDSLLLSGWERERRTGKPKATKIVYDVAGLGAPFQIGIWIEEKNGRLLANTLFFGPPKARGAS
jgi:hypothetical protein